ncbi:MAG: hypothetical protein WDN06_19915 [Asticcacaulis sp.]
MPDDLAQRRQTTATLATSTRRWNCASRRNGSRLGKGGLDAGLKQAHAPHHLAKRHQRGPQPADCRLGGPHQEPGALRDRLTEIIKTSSGKVSDLVDAEQQLASVQEEIDSRPNRHWLSCKSASPPRT